MNKDDEKKMEDIIEDIYEKLHSLKDEINAIKEHAIKMTLQGNNIFKILNGDDENIDAVKVEKFKEFDKDFYLESLISFISKDKDFEDLQKILDKYEEDISTDQHGES
jgi:hypothetical protein